MQYIFSLIFKLQHASEVFLELQKQLSQFFLAFLSAYAIFKQNILACVDVSLFGHCWRLEWHSVDLDHPVGYYNTILPIFTTFWKILDTRCIFLTIFSKICEIFSKIHQSGITNFFYIVIFGFFQCILEQNGSKMIKRP